MNQRRQDDLRAEILDFVDRHADLSRNPELLERVRTFLITRSVDENNRDRVTIEALREAGVHASVSASPDGRVIEIGGDYHSFLSSDESLPAIKGVHASHHSATRFRDVWPYIRRLLRNEKRDIWYVVIYSALSSLLGLVVPLSSQAIVNAVALGVFNQQLIVLCAVVLVAMLFTAGLAVLERYIIDLLQRRLFVRTAFDIVYRLPKILRRSLATTYAPELVNRFFDVMTVQKSIAKFLLDGINGLLVLLTGLILLGIYHPFFLVYDVVFLLFVPILVFILGRGAIATAVTVSKRKYEAAAWIEDVARNQLGFKLTNATDYAFDRIDDIGGRYVDAKHHHFVILARQIFGSYLFKAFATVGVLLLGGLLVIDQQISLGQLVAAEIIIILILGALEKLLNQFDAYYDFLAALDKLSAIAEQPLEDIGGTHLEPVKPLSVRLQNVAIALGPRAVLRDVSLEIPAGGRVSLVGRSGSGKSTILNLITGVYTPDRGVILIDGRDLREIDVQGLRNHIGYVLPEDSILDASVRDNILLGRELPQEQLEWALNLARLQDDIRELPAGIDTLVPSGGETISYGMRRRILFARMIVHRPKLLLIDEAFDGIEDAVKLEMFRDLFAWKEWTIINVSHDPELVRMTTRVCVLDEGSICESASPQELAERPGSAFARLFPDAAQFRTEGGQE